VKRTFSSRIRGGLPWLFLLVVIVHFLDSRGYLYELQMAIGPDLGLQQMDAKAPIDVSIIGITDDDYRDLFCSQSPLDGRGVIALIKRVQATMQPEAIGVDLDTSDWLPGNIPASCSKANLLCTTTKNGVTSVDQQCLMDELGKIKSKDFPTTVVWAQVPETPKSKETEKWMSRQWRKFSEGEREAGTILPLRPAATETSCLGPANSGIPIFPLDPDGEVRRYRRRFPVEPLSECPGKVTDHSLPSLPYALANACRSCIPGGWEPASEKNLDETRFLKFYGDEYAFHRVDAAHVLGQSATPVKDRKIVLIGGAYRGARDVYRTPLSRPRSKEMPGVDLLAQAIETDLHGGVAELNLAEKLLLDGTAGFVVLVLWAASFTFWSVSTRMLLFINIAVITGVFVLLSQVLFPIGIWLDCVAIAVGVVLHQIASELEAIEEYKEDIEDYKKDIHDRDKLLTDRQCQIDALNARIQELERDPGVANGGAKTG
jgi:CHASE2 domain-containing sensor protein